MITFARAYSRRSPGFSLLEVLVASAVLAVVLAILLSTLTTTLSLWRTTDSKIAADREGRSAELLLAQDISSAIMTTNPLLWPRVVNGDLLQFLTLKPADYQNAGAGDVGDVCLVEYLVDPETFSLVRRFWGSKQTFDILRGNNALPPPGGAGVDPQIVATNVLPEMHDAVRGLNIYREPLRTTFVILDQELMPINPPYAADNVPTVVEINIGVADPDAIRNKDLLSNPDFILRNAGFYSFRLGFPKVLR